MRLVLTLLVCLLGVFGATRGLHADSDVDLIKTLWNQKYSLNLSKAQMITQIVKETGICDKIVRDQVEKEYTWASRAILHKAYVKITYYCVPSSRCKICGTNNVTASGMTRTQLASRGWFGPSRKICATRGNKFPMGTVFILSNGTTVIRKDTGGSGVLVNKQIDIACASHAEAVKGGTRWEWVRYYVPK